MESDAKSAPPKEKTSGPPEDDAWTTPKPDWKRSDYEFALMHLIAMNDPDGAKRISDTFLSTDLLREPGSREAWDAEEEYWRLIFGKGGQLSRLKNLANDNKGNSEVLSRLGFAYEYYQQHADAGKCFIDAAKSAQNDAKRLTFLRQAAPAFQKAGNPQLAASTLAEMRSLAESSGAEDDLLKTQWEIAELAKEDDISLGTMERMVEIDPGDVETRFALAYKHSNLGSEDLALFHYSKIPYRERKDGTWNNLGVALDSLALPAKSVKAYSKAKELGNTLAMSNLAEKLISAGFLVEAKAICDSASAIKDYHKNVGRSISRLKEIPEEEDKKESDFLEKAKPLSDFYKEFGRAAGKPEPSALPTEWRGPNCVLNMTFENSILRAVGSYELPSAGLLASLLAGKSYGANPPAPRRFRVEYRGNAKGRAFLARVVRAEEGVPAKEKTLLTSNDDENKVLMLLTDNSDELKVMEKTKGSSAKFYSLKLQAKS